MLRIHKLILTSLLAGAAGFAQNATLGGQVADETGAVVPGAKITVGPKTATADNNGMYSITGLAPGSYSVAAAAPDLAMTPVKIVLKAGAQTLNLQLKVASTVQQVTVAESVGPVLSTDASSNAGQLTLRGADLDALSDDPEDLQADLEALAGPSAGPSGGSIFIDGFSGGELPPKDSIREIRINQNPFSPEYDHIGYGRIEIFTKPGTDRYRGTFFYNFANQCLELAQSVFAGESGPVAERDGRQHERAHQQAHVVHRRFSEAHCRQRIDRERGDAQPVNASAELVSPEHHYSAASFHPEPTTGLRSQPK